ncbi:MAG TPA: copper-binding protein [Thermoanaerobaculia bacterium]
MRAAVLLVLTLFLGCAADDDPSARPVSEAGERLFDLRGTILSQDTEGNALRIQHEAIPGFMEAMTMDFTVRGAKLAELPKPGSRVTAKLHVTTGSYWITDVRQEP